MDYILVIFVRCGFFGSRLSLGSAKARALFNIRRSIRISSHFKLRSSRSFPQAQLLLVFYSINFTMMKSESAENPYPKEDIIPLMQSDNEDTLDLIPSWSKASPGKSLSQRMFRFVLRLLLVTLAVIGLFRLSYDVWAYTTTTSASRSCSCGRSVDEALSLGCRFDPIAASWLPTHCMDDELLEEFNRSGDGPNGSWVYYTDFDKTGVLTEEQVGRLADVGGAFFTTYEWHIKHCTYNWRKLFRMKETGVILENRSNTIGHISHCEQVFMMNGGLHEVLTGSGVELNADQLPEMVKHKHDG